MRLASKPHINIQIRSFVKGGNHGQYLQALGLSQAVQKILPNQNVTHLNYHNHLTKELKIQTINGMILKYFGMRLAWTRNFKFSKIKSNNDITIFGSDMIWNLNSNLFPPDRIYFGSDINSGKRLSYAPSTASLEHKKRDWVSDLLKKFDTISVRDKNTQDFVKAHTGLDAEIVIDPCFFIDNENNTNPCEKPRSDKISVYGHQFKRLERNLYDFFGDQIYNNFSGINRVGYYKRREVFTKWPEQISDPLSILDNISTSKLLLTNTFHGTMMAVMTRTPFIAFMHPSLEARLNSPIINCFGKFRLLSENKPFSININDYISTDDFDSSALINYRHKSIAYLTQALVSP